MWLEDVREVEVKLFLFVLSPKLLKIILVLGNITKSFREYVI
jgi:hypothetical protein